MGPSQLLNTTVVGGLDCSLLGRGVRCIRFHGCPCLDDRVHRPEDAEWQKQRREDTEERNRIYAAAGIPYEVWTECRVKTYLDSNPELRRRYNELKRFFERTFDDEEEDAERGLVGPLRLIPRLALRGECPAEALE